MRMTEDATSSLAPGQHLPALPPGRASRRDSDSGDSRGEQRLGNLSLPALPPGSTGVARSVCRILKIREERH